MGLTRGDFVARVAAVGGNAYAAMVALDLLQPGKAAAFELVGNGNGTKVVILGAGVAGLCAAYELGKAGFDCRILEARARPGGRVWTVRTGTTETELGGLPQTAAFSAGLFFNPGPARVPQHHVTLDYYRELGIAIEPFININLNAYYHTAKPGAAVAKVRAREAQFNLRGQLAELLAKAVSHDALGAQLTAIDKEKLLAYLRERDDLDKFLRYAGSPHAGYAIFPGAGATPGTKLAARRWEPLIAAGFGRFASFGDEIDQQPQMYTPVGGIDALPHAFAARLGSRIAYGAEVTHIGKRPAGVRIAYRDATGRTRALDAAYAICTIPLPVLRDVPSDFSPAMRAAIANVAYAPTTKIGLEFKRRFWEEDDRILGGISWTDQTIGQIWYPSNGYLGRRGILTGMYTFAKDARAVGKLSLAQREALALRQGAALHPQYPAEFVTSFSVAWQHVRYSQGGWAMYTDATRAHDYPILNAPDDRIYLAGEHLSYINGWQAGALESARLVASNLSRRVAQTRAVDGSATSP
jgi:monoamine oxidase